MQTTFTPLGAEKHRLLVNTGLRCWHYDGEPEAGEVAMPEGRSVRVWLFRFQNIVEPAAQQHMVRAYMWSHGFTEAQATSWLLARMMAVPMKEVAISLTESDDL